MADENKKTRKKFRVAVSGATVDGREITRDQIIQMADSYNPQVYGARVNVEHYLSMMPGSDFSAMGDVMALSWEDLADGPLNGRTALYAEIEPTDRMKELTDAGKKIYSSVEIHPQFASTGNAYLCGLAMTDTPASLGTERLKFTAKQRAEVMAFNHQTSEPPLFTEAMEAEMVELASEQASDGRQWFSRVMGIIGKGRKTDSEQFSQVRQAVEGVAQSHADLLDAFSALKQQQTRDVQTIEKLSGDLKELRRQLSTEDASHFSRPAATGGNSGAQLVDY